VAATASTPFRNSASPASTACLATPAHSTTWGTLKVLYR
jgi:hypothetical protein